MAAAYLASFVPNSVLCFSRLSSLIFIVLYLRKDEYERNTIRVLLCGRQIGKEKILPNRELVTVSATQL